MPVACEACAEEILDGGSTCPVCGSPRTKTFASRGQLLAWREDRRVHGRAVEREPLPSRFRIAIPFLVVLGSVFLLAGILQSVAAARAGVSAFGLSTAASAIGPLAWGVALLAFARHIWTGGRAA